MKKLAIVNCYLQQGHKLSAEMEAAKRFIMVSKKMGICTKVFARAEDVLEFKPDLIINHAYQDPKLVDIPTFGTLTMPPSWVRGVARFERNILTYDGYLTLSRSVQKFVEELSIRNSISIPAIYGAFSAGRTEFKRIDFKKASAAYIGANWDGQRHGDFFQQFHLYDGSYLKCFGKKKSWNYLPKEVYGGPVPFDGQSVLERYSSMGIGLCLNHGDFDSQGIPTSRIFEIPASSALMIAGNNSLIKDIYKDSVLYVESNVPYNILVEQVVEKIDWVRSNPRQAEEMAKAAHDIFNKNLSLEVFINNIREMYEEIKCKDGRFLYFNSKKNGELLKASASSSNMHSVSIYNGERVSIIKRHFDSFLRQSPSISSYCLYVNFPLNWMARLYFSIRLFFIRKLINQYELQYGVKISLIESVSSSLERDLLHTFSKVGWDENDYVSIFSCRDTVFSDFSSSISLFLSEQKKIKPDMLDYGSIESSNQRLKELLKDPHNILRTEHLRVSNFSYYQSEIKSIFSHYCYRVGYIQKALQFIPKMKMENVFNDVFMGCNIEHCARLLKSRSIPRSEQSFFLRIFSRLVLSDE